MEQQKSILKEEWFTWLMYFLIPLFGIFLFWKNRFYPVFIRILITCLHIIPMSLIIGIIPLFIYTDLPDRLQSIPSSFLDEFQTNFPYEDIDEDEIDYTDDLMYYLDEMYSEEDWYYDMNEIWVEINYVGLKEMVTVNVYMDNPQKKGYEDKMYTAILEYCKDYHPKAYDGYTVKIYNPDEKVLFEKKEQGKQTVID